MRVIIFGTGAMACLFAGRLADAAQVTLLGTWSEAINAIRERGIRFEDSGGVKAIKAGAEFLGGPAEPADLIVILVKSWQTSTVAGCLAQYRAPGSVVITLQNGLGNLELLGPGVSPGSTAEGATIVGPGHVRVGGRGPTSVVAPEWVVRLFQSAGCECRSCDAEEADGLIWGKLTVSCGINALTALLRVPNGELLNRPNAADLMVRAAAECAEIAHAKGIRLPFSDPAARVREVAEKTAANLSSMLQDLLRGAPTECDAINGAIAAEGRQMGIPTPVNDILWQLVQAAVHQSRSDIR